MPLTQAQDWAPPALQPTPGPRPKCGRGWHLLPILPVPQFPTLCDPSRAWCCCRAPRRKPLVFYYPSAAPMAKPALQAPAQEGAQLQHQSGAGQANTTDWESKVSPNGTGSPRDTGMRVAKGGTGSPDPCAPQSPGQPGTESRPRGSVFPRRQQKASIFQFFYAEASVGIGNSFVRLT